VNVRLLVDAFVVTHLDMVVKNVHVEAETDSVLFERYVFKVEVAFAFSPEATAQMDDIQVVGFVNENEVVLFVDVEPPRIVFDVVFSD
jgi:hypothetical protein